MNDKNEQIHLKSFIMPDGYRFGKFSKKRKYYSTNGISSQKTKIFDNISDLTRN
ncbi:hypothetical protein GCM10023338_06800 [Wohlfahrtiimonas larvae]|uniref:Uncharacterized protein n=1 Tax=Wohlfahrtiimonas larvae TaxID=1157986 RepID=A0ABP9MGL5_9GAMM